MLEFAISTKITDHNQIHATRKSQACNQKKIPKASVYLTENSYVERDDSKHQPEYFDGLERSKFANCIGNDGHLSLNNLPNCRKLWVGRDDLWRGARELIP